MKAAVAATFGIVTQVLQEHLAIKPRLWDDMSNVAEVERELRSQCAKSRKLSKPMPSVLQEGLQWIECPSRDGGGSARCGRATKTKTVNPLNHVAATNALTVARMKLYLDDVTP